MSRADGHERERSHRMLSLDMRLLNPWLGTQDAAPETSPTSERIRVLVCSGAPSHLVAVVDLSEPGSTWFLE
jgi:hypothetical protein